MDVNTVIPFSEIIAGDTFRCNIDLTASGYTATQYTLKYVFKKVGVNPMIVTSAANPDGSFLMLVSSSTTGTYTAGNYSVVATMTNNSTSERYTVAQTEIQIIPDYSTSITTFDPRSPNQIILDEIDTALTSALSDTITEYTIGGRTVRKNKTELLKLRQYYAAKVRTENGQQQGNIIRYGFGAAPTWFF